MPISKAGKLYFTDEQYNVARYDSSALEYAKAKGYDLVQKGKYYTMREHDSMVFTQRGGWFWNSHNISGGAIEFMTHYEHKPLAEAVVTLAGENEHTKEATPSYAPQTNKPAKADAFQLPERNDNHRRMFAYLIKTRGIDEKLVSSLQKSKLLYESKSHHNAVFVFRNHAGLATGAFLRSTNTNIEQPFRGMATGSDRTSSCFYFGGSEEASVACICEGSIDAMSYASLQARAGNDDFTQRYYIASGGSGDGNILAFLSHHPQIRMVILCHDNDAAGHRMAEDLTQKLKPMNYQIGRSTPQGKDFNDDLCKLIQREQQESAQGPDQLELEV